MEDSKSLYLKKCHAKGWAPNDNGMIAFSDQMDRGWRDKEGELVWPEESFIASVQES